jgi:aminoglycoside phosphotransferase family enzyme/predicted kinase
MRPDGREHTVDEPARIHETHISWITLIGERAYKLLKPVETGFLDHRTIEARHEACLREVEQNRRFAPDVYLGVLDVLDGDGRVRDHLIEMRRLPSAQRLSALAQTPDAGAHVQAVAREIAAIHARAPRSPLIDRCGEAAHLRELWQDGWRQLGSAAPGVIDDADIARAARMARRFLDGRGPLLRARIADGWIRDGHGDLLADDVYVTADGPRVLDCLAFDDTLRAGDVLADAAFLAMDLESLGHPDLSRALVTAWSNALGEEHPASLLHHYIAYRAHVRAKVAALRYAQGDEGARARARALHGLCLDHLEAGRVRLVMIGGAPGTGKSTVARALSDRTGWSLLATDALRSSVVGPPGPHGEAYGQGRYAEVARDRVYKQMRAAAGQELAMGRSVILDASWSSASQRRVTRRLARDLSAEIVELRCDAPAEVCAERIASRRDDPSEATAAVAARMRADYDPWPAADEIPTGGPLATSVARAADRAGAG